MNFWLVKTKVFAFFFLFAFLFFVNFAVAVNAQTNQSIYQLQAGTLFRVSMDNEINSKVASVNDTFTATLAEPVVVRETVILPVGTIIEGRVTRVKRASFGGRNGAMEVSFQTLRFADGNRRDIEGILVNELILPSSPATSILTIGGGTAFGGIIGAVSKTENGALLGAGIGAGIGTAAALLRKGKNVGIKSDAKFQVKLTKDVILPVRDF